MLNANECIQQEVIKANNVLEGFQNSSQSSMMNADPNM